jgi:putative mRNA 3-end processing factor
MDGRQRRARAFSHRGGGVRIAETIVACDAAIGTDLVFLSHAPTFGVHARRALPRLGGARRQLLTTDVTLALLGPAGERLKSHALPAGYGRPFSLGDLRLEMFPSGFMPGAASLLCECDGRRIVYAGPIGADAGDVRAADALCIDATFAGAGGGDAAPLPPRAQALAEVGRAVRAVLARGDAPIVLVDPAAIAVDVAAALAADRIGLAAHRAIVQVAAAYRHAGIPAPPLQRFATKLGPGEALLWPAQLRAPARRGGARAFGTVLVSADAGSALAAADIEARVIFPTGADRTTLIRYVEATGASEVALVNAPGDELGAALRARGIDAYTLGPPRQIELFAAA